MLRRSALAATLATLLCALPTLAIVPADIEQYEVRLPGSQVAPIYDTPDPGKAAGLLPGLTEFQAGEGKGWRILQWNEALGVPAAMAGPAIPVCAPEASVETIREAAERFVARHALLLKLDPRDLRILDVTDLGKDRVAVLFGQFADGIPVINGRLDLVLWKGRIVLISDSVYGGVDAGRFPSLDASTATQAAHLGIPETAGDRAVDSPRRVVLPIHHEGGVDYHLAWEVRLGTTSPEGLWRTYVDARDGSILWRESEREFLELTGSSQGAIEMRTVGDPYQDLPLPEEKITATGGGTYTGYTNLDGDYTVTVPSQMSYTVTGKLLGRWTSVFNSAAASAAIVQTGAPGTPVDYSFNDTNSHPAERDAFYHVNVIHSWIKALDPAFTGMDTAMPTTVNIGGSAPLVCNAYYSAGTLNFYLEGGGCNNSGRIADVIYHEYGHGITAKYYYPIGSPTSSGMGEGFSDTDAMTIQNDPLIGEGFYQSGSPAYLRTGDYSNLKQYPGTECAGEVHCLGEIFTGAMWKTRDFYNMRYGAAAAAHYDPTWITARKGRASSMPLFLTYLLQADDDDGDLTNGSPNWQEICEAFETHNLPCPALTNYVDLVSDPIPDQPTAAGGYPVVATAVAVGPGEIDPASVQILYTLEPPESGPLWSSAIMTATANPNEYAGEIPNQGCGKLIYYYVRAAKVTGESATAPVQAPYRQYFEFVAGPYATALVDDLEADRGWTIGAPGDNAVEGIWERTNPAGKSNATYGPTQPEDDHTAAGTNCFVTDGRGGVWAQYDVDNGVTSLLSPSYDWSAYEGFATVSYWAFVFADFPADDSLRCAISNDGGSTWHEIGRIGGRQNAWGRHVHRVTSDQIDFTGQMRIRFQAEDVRTQSICVEAAIDDIEIRVTTCVAAGAAESEAATPFTVDPCRPNPFSRETAIRFGLPGSRMVDVEVFDAGGRKVRTLLHAERGAGSHSVIWDGTNEGGSDVGSGLYWLTVRAGGEKASRKAIVLR